MTSEYATVEDLSAAMTYTRSSARVSKTFNTVYEHIKTLGELFQYGKARRASMNDADEVGWDSDRRLVWGWTYLNASTTSGDAYFGYGLSLDPAIAFPKALPPIPPGNYAVLIVGWEKKWQIEKLAKLQLKSTWHVSDSDLMALNFEPIGDYLTRPEDFAAKLNASISAKVTDITAIATASR